MKTLCVIPARLGSTRLPRKPLALINGKPLVLCTYEAAMRCQTIDKVIVATDSDEVASVITAVGGTVILSPKELSTGTDRVAYVAKQYPDYAIVINLQGDEPFIKAKMLTTLIQAFHDDETVNMATLGSPLDFATQYQTPDIVKVLRDKQGDAIYFSRAPIPHFRENSSSVRAAVDVLHHKGVYGFRAAFLHQYAKLEKTPLEIAESLEQLRALEHGFKIRVCKVADKTLEINTPEELAEAQLIAKET